MASETLGSRPRYPISAFITPLPFYVMHVLAVAGVIYYGWSWSGFALAVASYYVRMTLVGGWYHRYFSHRTFKTSRWLQFVMAVICHTTVQKGVLWWASHHRRHHKYSDLDGDVHSVKKDGFLWSHVGWIVVQKYHATEESRVQDWMKYPELVWADRLQVVPVILFGLACYLLGGWHAFLWAFLVSTVALWHGTFTINSLAHVFGTRRYETTDTSRNNWYLALLTGGEGWHNNHHKYAASVNQGFKWWEIDTTLYYLRALAAVGLIWDLRTAPAEVVADTIDAKAAKAATATTPAAAPMLPLTRDLDPAE